MSQVDIPGQELRVTVFGLRNAIKGSVYDGNLTLVLDAAKSARYLQKTGGLKALVCCTRCLLRNDER